MDDPAKQKVWKCGRRGGKTVLEIAEAGATCIDDRGLCGWGAPNYKILADAWRDIQAEFAPFIKPGGIRVSDWTIDFYGGGRLECWSFDSGIVARSRKYHKFVIDEAGLIPRLAQRYDQEVEPTLGDYDGVLVAGSTPNLVSPDFSKWFKLGQTPGSGWKSWQWSSLDNPHVADQMRRRIAAARARGVPEWIIQQEYFANETDTSRGFFPRRMIEQHTQTYAFDPVTSGTLTIPLRLQSERDVILTHGKFERMEWQEDTRGPWKLWFDVRKNRPGIKTLRPCAGCDIGCGVGASNSVLSFGDSDTGEKIAEYAYPGDSPEELARIAVAFGYWIGGKGGPARINFEANGPGEQFIKILRQLDYPNIHARRVSPVKVTRGPAGEYGWWNTHTAKASMLSEYRSALTTGDFRNPSESALSECLEYHIDKANRVFHEREMADAAPDDSGAEVPHGDRVIADGLLHQCMLSNPISDPEEFEPPPDTPAARMREIELEEAGTFIDQDG